MFIRIWQFRPDPQKISEFESAYGPDGDWAHLFKKSPGFIGTELLRSLGDGSFYFTIDRWDRVESWEDFLSVHSEEYKALDEKCIPLTIEEVEVGNFVSKGLSPARHLPQ
jgi:heme-degrading monooxygenase HmoA